MMEAQIILIENICYFMFMVKIDAHVKFSNIS